MSFLFPLYAAGLLAVSLPILFHLIRRTPQTRMQFSSLMFLAPSPPRLTRRSRLDQILLLLLRGLALSLLALAFARPFLRASTAWSVGAAEGRRIAIVLDTSASMQRSGVWTRALAELDDVLGDLAPSDRVALFEYNDAVTPLLRFDESDEATADSRMSMIRTRAKRVTPTWGGSNLGLALASAAEALAEAEVDENRASGTPTAAKIILISDLQQGSDLKSLDAFAWPDDVNVEIRTVRPDQPDRTNAGVHLLGSGLSVDDGTLRVRVINGPRSKKERFELAWEGAARTTADPPTEAPTITPTAPSSEATDAPSGEQPLEETTEPTDTVPAGTAPANTEAEAADGEVLADGQIEQGAADAQPADELGAQDAETDSAELEPVVIAPASPQVQTVYVPMGQRRTVQMDRFDDAAVVRTVLELKGDDDAFDNTLYVAPQRQRHTTVAYLGEDDPNDAQGLLYYLNRVYPETPLRRVDVVAPADDQPLAPAGQQKPRFLVVAHASLSTERIEQVREFLSGGGRVLVVVWTVEMGDELGRLLADDPLQPVDIQLEESPQGIDYSLLGEIDFTHPLFVLFADPRFSDFTKIHFWKHRALSTEALEDARIVARFDNGDPALVEFHRGAGTLWVLTSGWDPYDSQFARSSKFVPLMSTMLAGSDWEIGGVQYMVNDPFDLTGMTAESDELVVVRPDGTEFPLAAGARSFDKTEQPGIYTVRGGEEPIALAVNLTPRESETAPMEHEQLEQRGVRLGEGRTPEQDAELRRQKRREELEREQKMWRYMIVVALVTLIGETWLAGRKSGKSHQPQEA
jgi:hypothetical protein